MFCQTHLSNFAAFVDVATKNKSGTVVAIMTTGILLFMHIAVLRVSFHRLALVCYDVKRTSFQSLSSCKCKTIERLYKGGENVYFSFAKSEVSLYSVEKKRK